MDDLQHELDAVARRTLRSYFQDGVAEMSSATVFLLVAAYFVVQRAWRNAAHDVLLNLVFPLTVLALVLAARWTIRVVKDRYVHPRTGYVSFRRREGHRWAHAALAFAIGILMTLLISRTPILVNWIPALEGLVFAAGFLYFGRKFEILRFSVDGLLCAVAGAIVAAVRLDEDVAAALIFAWLGVVLGTGGLLAFMRYRRQTPPPEEP
jgi:hypothetical protein